MKSSWHEGFGAPPITASETNDWMPADLLSGAPVASDDADDVDDDAPQRAYCEGHAAGLEEGARAEREHLQSCVRALEEAAEVFSQSSAEWTTALEENIAAIAVAAARLIVDSELAVAPDTISRIVARALAEFSVDESVQVRLNPNDLAILNTVQSPDGGALPAQSRYRWIADANILPGGCVVTGRERIVDGRVDNVLERIYRRLVHQHA